MIWKLHTGTRFPPQFLRISSWIEPDVRKWDIHCFTSYKTPPFSPSSELPIPPCVSLTAASISLAPKPSLASAWREKEVEDSEIGLVFLPHSSLLDFLIKPESKSERGWRSGPHSSWLLAIFGFSSRVPSGVVTEDLRFYPDKFDLFWYFFLLKVSELFQAKNSFPKDL